MLRESQISSNFIRSFLEKSSRGESGSQTPEILSLLNLFKAFFYCENQAAELSAVIRSTNFIFKLR
jgi:hypothetical protein